MSAEIFKCPYVPIADKCLSVDNVDNVDEIRRTMSIKEFRSCLRFANNFVDNVNNLTLNKEIA